MKRKPKLLIVDDEKSILGFLQTTLQKDFEVFPAENGAEALAIFDKHHFDMVLTDIRMPGIDGLQLLQTIKKLCQNCEVLLMTGYADTNMAINALNEGAFALITKPLNTKMLLRHLNHARVIIQHHESQEKVLKEMKSELIMQSLFTQRLSALAAMAGGIAHEMHQPLSGIGLYASTLQNMITENKAIEPDYLFETLKKINSQVDRAAKVIEHMREFSSGESSEEIVTLNLKDAIKKSLELFDIQLQKHGIELRMDVPHKLHIQANINRFEQVIINLTSNARDSLIEKSLIVKKIDWPKLIHIQSREDKDKILIDVIDSGMGVPKELRKTLFDPFVTGKKTAKGSGLGLAICKRILMDFDAGIELLKTGSEGSTFRMQFPKNKG